MSPLGNEDDRAQVGARKRYWDSPLWRIWKTFDLWSQGFEWRRSWWFVGGPAREWLSRNEGDSHD